MEDKFISRIFFPVWLHCSEDDWWPWTDWLSDEFSSQLPLSCGRRKSCCAAAESINPRDLWPADQPTCGGPAGRWSLESDLRDLAFSMIRSVKHDFIRFFSVLRLNSIVGDSWIYLKVLRIFPILFDIFCWKKFVIHNDIDMRAHTDTHTPPPYTTVTPAHKYEHVVLKTGFKNPNPV